MNDDAWFMNLALEQAHKAYKWDEVPVGAIIVDKQGKVLSSAHNEKEGSKDPCGHAEVLALTRAAKEINSWRLSGSTVYVTLEPCPMCLMAMVHARIGRLVFGTYDPKGGALSLGLNFHRNPKFNHRFSVVGGVAHLDCSRVLSQFFREKRKYYKKVSDNSTR